MTKSLDPRARIAAQKSLRRTVLCTAGRAIIAAILFAIACVTAPEASAQLDSVLKNLLQNAMPTAPTTPPNYRPVYPPPPYPSYPPQPAAPPNPAYRAYSAPPPAPSAAAPAVADAGRVADLQRMLNELGYDAGPADGQPGSRTVQAVRAFQRDHGQPVTGEMTEVTVAAVRGVWYERSRSAGAMPAAAGPSAVRPSFDCARASNPTERQICASPQLATLDARLSQAFGNASADKSPDDRASLMADEQRWLQQRNACGGDAACIERSINEHLAQLQAPRAVDNGGQEPARGLVVSGARDSSQPPTSAASTAPVGISVDELLHPSQGLRPLRLRIWDGMPLLHHSDSSDTEAFLDLVTLGIRPDLLEVKDSLLDQVAEYSRTFLNRADPLNAQNWSTRNEFEKKDARAAFLRQYAEPLRRLAPRAPFRFAYATAASLGRYDVKRRGFDLTGMGSYALQRVDPLQPGGIQLVHGRIGVVPRYDFDMPSPFWPIEEAAARALIAPLFGPNDRGERRVQAITVFEATDAEPQTVTLGLQIERLEIWDDPLTTRLYSFDVAPLRHQKLSTASSLQRLLHPPAELRPWPLSSLDGRPAIGAYDVWEASFQKWVLAADLFRLVAAGTIPGYLEDRNNLPSVQHMFSDQVIREVFLGGPGGWAGSDEFAQARARETYYSRYAPVLRKLAPRPPFEFIYVQDAMLGPYVAERRAFPVNQQNDSGDLLQRVREANLIPAPTFSPAGLFWPIDPGRAEAILNTLSNRKVKTAATYQIASLDSASKRLVINLKALSLYTPDLKTKLYEFPVSNDPEPYLSAGTPARLKVTEQAALDDLFFCLKFIEAGGEQISMQIVAKCWNVVAERDKRFYTRSDHGADLALDDARRPFFPRGGADPTSAGMARFLEWAKIYAASLPETVAAPPSIGIPYGTRLAQVLAEGKAPQRERYAKLLSEKHLQEDQLIYINSPLYYNGESVEIIFILPNRRALYSMTVPKEALDRHPGTNPQSVANFRVGAARIIRNDLGQRSLRPI